MHAIRGAIPDLALPDIQCFSRSVKRGTPKRGWRLSSVDWLIGLVIGAILSALLTPLIEAFLPVDIRFRVQYSRKWLIKQISRPIVQVNITVKTPDISAQELSPAKVADDLKQAVILDNHEPQVTQDEVHFRFEVGKTTINGILRAVVAPKSHSLIVCQIEAQVQAGVPYRGFANGVHELTEATHIIEEYLRKFVPSPLPERAVECKLKSLYELTGILSDYNVEQLSASMDNDGYRLDLAKDGIIVYVQRTVDSSIIVLLQKLVTFYY
jgi:hypothetical protein